ncbi:MAG: hypothetical protein IIA03_09750 [Proteobacteria bacterium]|nr:hypothetical protein [Pseudomonadota bacterium]
MCKYVTRLTVKTLIDDINKVIINGKQPKSLLYFMHSMHGACRWENLVLQQMERLWRKKKNKLNKALEPIAKELNFSNDSRNGDPDWVNKSRREFEQLKKNYQLAKLSEKSGVAQYMRLIQEKLRHHNYKL